MYSERDTDTWFVINQVLQMFRQTRAQIWSRQAHKGCCDARQNRADPTDWNDIENGPTHIRLSVSSHLSRAFGGARLCVWKGVDKQYVCVTKCGTVRSAPCREQGKYLSAAHTLCDTCQMQRSWCAKLGNHKALVRSLWNYMHALHIQFDTNSLDTPLPFGWFELYCSGKFKHVRQKDCKAIPLKIPKALS